MLPYIILSVIPSLLYVIAILNGLRRDKKMRKKCIKTDFEQFLKDVEITITINNKDYYYFTTHEDDVLIIHRKRWKPVDIVLN